MSDEIDIEEHDVLDNPLLKRIFPDLSIIKKEISQFFDEEPGVIEGGELAVAESNLSSLTPCSPQSSLKDLSKIQLTCKDVIFTNKIILGTKPSIEKHQVTNEGKLNTQTKTRHIRIPKVVLQDLKTYLERSRRYCKDCFILFSRISDLYDHNMCVHNKKLSGEKTNNQCNILLESTRQCNICKYTSSNRFNLKRHYINVHYKMITFASNNPTISKNYKRNESESQCHNNVENGKTANKVQTIIQNKIKDISNSTIKSKSNKCNICLGTFANYSNLRRHYIRVHKIQLTVQRSRSMNKHIKLDNKRCNICNTNFSTYQALMKHTKNIHNAANSKKDTKTDKCFHCDKIFPDANSLIEHVYQILEPRKKESSKSSYTKPNLRNKQNEKKINNEPEPETSNEETIVERDRAPTVFYAQEKVVANEESDVDDIDSNDNWEEENSKGDHDDEKQKNNLSKKHNNLPNCKIKKRSKEIDEMYTCPHCSLYLADINTYQTHLNIKHNIKTNMPINKESFQSQCKYCPSSSNNKSAHNTHLYKKHRNLLNKKINNSREKKECKDYAERKNKAFALESMVYKCLKCDINFLTASVALNHLEHMEQLINWKCPFCNHIFKKEDEKMHLKQHSYSKDVVTYELKNSSLSSLLYCCPKCTIHFSETRYNEHYLECEIKTTISVYCKVCDLLIDQLSADDHKKHHQENKTKEDFDIITSDIITDESEKYKDINEKSKTLRKKRKLKRKFNYKNDEYRTIKVKKMEDDKYSLTLCPTCKCFLNNMAVNKQIHVAGRCADMPRHVCTGCGLMLTAKTLSTHKINHAKNKMALQDFKFYDIKGNRIKPPFPDLPQCLSCKVHFIRKATITRHDCKGLRFYSCRECKLKFSEIAYKLHTSYHNYSIDKSNRNINEIEETSSPVSQTVSKVPGLDKNQNKSINELKLLHNIVSKEMNENVKFKENDQSDLNSNLKSKENIQNDNLLQINGTSIIIYSCESCHMTMDTYDKIIEHCQNHFTKSSTKSEDNFRVCTVCSLKCDDTSFDNHEKIHNRGVVYKVFNVDPSFLILDNARWLKYVFDDIDTEVINRLIETSMYRYEHRVRMRVSQKGPLHLTMYKCRLCTNFIDPVDVYKHTKCSCIKIRKNPCSLCGLPFTSMDYLARHKTIHQQYKDINLRSYHIIEFNRKEDNENIIGSLSQYVIYQCRNCNGSIDNSDKSHECNVYDLKQCPECGLLLFSGEFDNHVSKHQILASFTSENIKVVLFGSLKPKIGTSKTMVSNFAGIVYDYTFYKCEKCETCLKNYGYVAKHVCLLDNEKINCAKCGFFFSKKCYKKHIQLHNIETELKKENMNVIPFNPSNEEQSNLTISEKEIVTSKSNNVAITIKSHENSDTTDSEVVILLKCVCGLHFLDSDKIKIHLKQCPPKGKIYKQSCAKCNLIFTPTELFTHLLRHHGDKCKSFKFIILTTPADKEGKNIIFECSGCKIHFSNSASAYSHFRECNGDIKNSEKCSKCGLLFEKSNFDIDDHINSCEQDYNILTFAKNNITELLCGINVEL